MESCHVAQRQKKTNVGGNFKKKIPSESLAVHPDQVPEFTEAMFKAGLPTTFDSEGRSLINSAHHARKVAKTLSKITGRNWLHTSF